MPEKDVTPPQNVDPEAAEVVQASTVDAEQGSEAPTEPDEAAPAVDQAKQG